jgi:ubiquinone/menaquinone biosynthesis C-methylase UbiE
MSLYSKFILPNLVHFACGQRPAMRQRERVVPLAHGRVLEVGFGSGLNLPFYDASKVSKLWGLDPSPEMTRMAESRVQSAAFDVEIINLPIEEVSLESGSIDTVLVTYTLCTIPDIERATREMTRVLRPGGQLVFCEHGESPDANIRRWQNGINPVWKRIGGGCHLNRKIPRLIEQGGFTIRQMKARYLPGWRPASFNYWGVAIRG